MPFWKRRPKYEDPVETEPERPDLSKKESRQLAKLRKKANVAARRAARESERAREAARRVQSAASSEEAREQVAEPVPDVPEEIAGKERRAELAKKEHRRLKKLRRKAQRSS